MPQNDLSGPAALNLLFPGLVALSAIIMTILGSGPLLRSARPPVPVTEELRRPVGALGVEAIKARPWEDPLSVYEDQQPDPESERQAQLAAEANLPLIQSHYSERIREVKGEKGKTLVLFPLVPSGGDSDTHETRIRYRNAVIAALTEQGYYLSYPKRLTYFDLTVPIYPAQLPKQLKPENAPATPVVTREVGWQRMLNSWSRAFFREGWEWSSRLVANTGLQHAVPGDRHEIKPRLTTIRISVKLYRRAEKPPSTRDPESVLVFWIDEDRLGHAPLDALARIYSKIFRNVMMNRKRHDELHLAILGPYSSDGLRTMNRELDRVVAEGDATEFAVNRFRPARVTLVSPRATAYCSRKESRSPSERSQIVNFEDFATKAHSQMGIHAHTVIGNDRDLAIALREELRLRGAWPAPWERRKKILLLTERDTSYGRDWQVLFHQLTTEETAQSTASPDARQYEGNILGTGTDSDEHPYLILQSYLRGIDGIVPARDRFSDQNGQSSMRDADEEPALQEPASGNSQYDYLRRLAKRLQEEYPPWRLDGQQIAAVGIIATDVYDKLLLTRALRNSFPHAQYFTTDLDAELWTRAELPYTRNLIVASHFDLRAGERVQSRTPEFRDSYQTSTYLAVLAALENTRQRYGPNPVNLYENCSPWIFEIGGTGPVRFVQSKSRDQQVHSSLFPRPPRLLGFRLAPTDAVPIRHPMSEINRNLLWWTAATVIFFAVVLLLYLSGVKWLERGIASLGEQWSKRRQPANGSGNSAVGGQTDEHAQRASSSIARACQYVGTVAFLLLLIRYLVIGPRPAAFLLAMVFAISLLTVAGARRRLVMKCRRSRKNQRPKGTSELLWLFQGRHKKCTNVTLLLVFSAVVAAAVVDHMVLFWWWGRGEPVALTSGISSWPGTVLRAITLGLVGVFIAIVIRDTKESRVRIRNSRKSPDFTESWRELFRTGRLFRDIQWVYMMTWATGAVLISLLIFTRNPTLHTRGMLAWLVGYSILILAVFATVFLNFLVMHVIQRTRHRIDGLRNWQSNSNDPGGNASSESLPPLDVSEMLVPSEVTPPHSIDISRSLDVEYSRRKRAEGAFAVVSAIGTQTNAAGKLLIYPAMAALLLLAAQYPWLDGRGPSVTIFIITIFVLAFPFVTYIGLRRSAAKLRKNYLICLNREEQRSRQEFRERRAQYFAYLGQRIRDVRKGAYRPWGDDWVLRALLIPLGGSSGLLVLENLPFLLAG